MKILFLFLLALPSLAHANGPNYKIPRGATSNQETCVTADSLSRARGGGWGDAESETRSDAHRLTYWNDGETFFSLQEANDGSRARFSALREIEVNREFTRREKNTTLWTKDGGNWKREDFTTEERIVKKEGAYVRVTETTGGLSLEWEIRTFGDDADQVTVRRLLNPEALNSDDTRFISREETCRFRVGR